MNILFLTTTLAKGGAEKQLFQLISGLKRKKIDIHLLVLENGEYESKYKKIGVTPIILTEKKYKNIFKYIPLFIKEIKKIKPDIIHSFLFHTNILMKLTLFFMKKKFKLICSYRGELKKYPLIHALEFINMNKADLLISNSVSSDNNLNNTIWRKINREIIANGIKFKTLNKQIIKTLKKKYEGKRIILTVGNLRKEKDYSTNMKTCLEINKYKKNVTFLYVGIGPEEKKIRNQIKKSKIKNIHLLGRREDILELLKISEIFFLPTITEGQSNALIEAMYSKIPIITTNIAANKLLVPYANFCDVGNHKDMAKKIIHILGEGYSRNKLQENKTKVETKLILKNMINDYYKTYEELLCVE